MIKLPWGKKVKISMNDIVMENFIKDMLSCPKDFVYRSMFQSIEIDIDVKHPERLRRRIFHWLVERCQYET